MLTEFLLLMTAHIFAVASPGADFAVVLKNTLQSGRKAGIYTAVGIGLGIFVHLTYTLFGVAILLSRSSELFNLIKITGAAYILWLAFQSFRARQKRAASISSEVKLGLSSLAAVKQGFIVNALNPKVTLFFVALFTTIVSQQTPQIIQAFYGVWLALVTTMWFIVVAWWFSTKKVLDWYQAHGHYIDWLMGTVLFVIALRLLFTL